MEFSCIYGIEIKKETNILREERMHIFIKYAYVYIHKCKCMQKLYVYMSYLVIYVSSDII